MFKVGDRVMLVGDVLWNTRIKKDIGLIGTVVEVNRWRTRVRMINSNSGNPFWMIEEHKGIKKVEYQMQFSFMDDAETN